MRRERERRGPPVCSYFLDYNHVKLVFCFFPSYMLLADNFANFYLGIDFAIHIVENAKVSAVMMRLTKLNEALLKIQRPTVAVF